MDIVLHVPTGTSTGRRKCETSCARLSLVPPWRTAHRLPKTVVFETGAVVPDVTTPEHLNCVSKPISINVSELLACR